MEFCEDGDEALGTLMNGVNSWGSTQAVSNFVYFYSSVSESVDYMDDIS